MATDSHHAAKLHLAAEALRSFGKVRLAVQGVSMVPSIFPGDLLTICRAGVDDVRCGDVILYARQDRVFAHRVVRKQVAAGGVRLITRGDTLSEEDRPVSEVELLGRVTALERHSKRLALVARRSRSNRFVSWCLEHSEGLLGLLLRWHSLRGRLAAGRIQAAPPMQSFERGC